MLGTERLKNLFRKIFILDVILTKVYSSEETISLTNQAQLNFGISVLIYQTTSPLIMVKFCVMVVDKIYAECFKVPSSIILNYFLIVLHLSSKLILK